MILANFFAVFLNDKNPSLFCRLFLLRGADTSIKNKEGKMPMDVRLEICCFVIHCLQSTSNNSAYYNPLDKKCMLQFFMALSGAKCQQIMKYIDF